MPAQTVIKLRRDTAADWASVNPVLADGEVGLESDSGLVKYGNGTSQWSDLPYTTASSVKTKVQNNTGSSIPKGSVVYISGASGDNPRITLADADTETTSSKTLGLTEATIANGGQGYVIESGLITGLDTAAATAGQSVWLSSTAGQFVFNAPPAKPAHSVYLGVVIRAHANQGAILVKVQNGYELNELHDVNAGNPSTNDVLQWNGTAWVNADVVTQVTSAIVDSAPSTLDTLNELAAALGDDANFATTVTNALAGKASTTHTHAISDVTNLQTSLDAKAPLANPTFTGTVSGITKAMVGLDNVDNTSDANKPISTATQTALDGKAAISHTHSISNVTGLQTALDGKLSATVTSPTSGQFISYNGTTWTNVASPAAPISVGPNNNIAVPTSAIGNKADTTENIAVGTGSLAGAINFNGRNVAIGGNAMNAYTGAYSVGIGGAALQKGSSWESVAIGYQAAESPLNSNGLGQRSVVIGHQAARAVNFGESLTAVGAGSLVSITSGSWNTAIGRSTLRSVTTGNNNTSIGGPNFTLTTGSNNTMLGYGAEASSATVSNEITLGDSQITNLRCNDTTISGLSDARDKTQVTDMEYGLDFIEKLRPVNFIWNQRDGGRVGLKDSGFIAQELMSVEDQFDANEWLHLTSRNNEERYEAAPGRLIPVLVKAVQELSAEVKALKEQING